MPMLKVSKIVLINLKELGVVYQGWFVNQPKTTWLAGRIFGNPDLICGESNYAVNVVL